jgi:hypothetical protein
MEHTRFDAITRTLTTTSTRRDTFRALAAAGLGLGALRLGLDQADAKGKGKKKVTARCHSTDECSGTLQCQKANSQHTYAKTQKRCCVKEGDPCNDGKDCCGIDVICNGGKCDNA